MERAVYLVSGGIDSPVAAYLGIMRGWKPTFVYFDTSPFAGDGGLERAMKTIARVETVTGAEGKTVVVPHGTDLAMIVERCKRNLSCLLCKRMMYRKAATIARYEGCKVIVTGEILGEQASQTLRNLILNSAVVDLPVFRPLIGMNKLEVEGVARRIGTFDISTSPAGPCTAAALKARTRARKEELDREEAKLPVQELLSSAVGKASTVRP